DVPISENSPICEDHSEIFSDSKDDDDISVTMMILRISSTLKRQFLILRLSCPNEEKAHTIELKLRISSEEEKGKDL
nr:hypothetical protein [Tanacetum cinerariifolium]